MAGVQFLVVYLFAVGSVVIQSGLWIATLMSDLVCGQHDRRWKISQLWGSLQVSDALSLTRPDLSGDEASLNKPLLLNVSTDDASSITIGAAVSGENDG